MIIGNDRIIQWATFDGTNDYLARGADLTSNADSKVMTFSCWFTLADTSGGGRCLIGNTNSTRFYFDVTTAGIMNLRARDGSGNQIIDTVSTVAVDDGQIHHVMASFDAATSASHLYIDGVDRKGTTSMSNFSVDWTTPNWYIGAIDGALERWNGKIGQLYFDNQNYTDLSLAANRLKFWNYGPVTIPSASSARIYLPNAFGSLQTNSGTGGNFTVTGALADGGTYP